MNAVSRPASLFDVELLDAMPRVRDMSVGAVSAEDVREFAARYHYTGNGGRVLRYFGLWSGATLFGIVTYNTPTPNACRSVFGPEFERHVWHMGRLVLADSAPRNSESRLIGLSLRLLEKDPVDIHAVLTYADSSVGHIGYVYQATNAIYTGVSSIDHYYVDQNGGRKSRRSITGLYHGRKVDGDESTRARAFGWERREGAPKHRYVYLLGSRHQRAERLRRLQLPVLPYPKEATE